MAERIHTDLRPVDAESVLELQATLLSHDPFGEAATALAGDIADRLHFDRVSIGLTAPDQGRIVAFSHSSGARLQPAERHAIATAMMEAIEQSATVRHPGNPHEIPRIILAHAALARLSGNQIASIPLCHNGQILGAMTIERGASMPLGQNEISSCEHVACLLGPILLLKWEAEQPWHAQPGHAVSALVQQLRTHVQLGARLNWCAGMAVAIALLFIPVQYNIKAPARIENQTPRPQVASEPAKLVRGSPIDVPFDGIVLKGGLRPSADTFMPHGGRPPTVACRLTIEVDESEVNEVQPKQAGKLALRSFPDRILPFQVQAVTPVAIVRDGRNFFAVEASLASDTRGTLLLPGLEGVAKIRIGQRPLIWIWTHHAIAWAEFKLWSWGL